MTTSASRTHYRLTFAILSVAVGSFALMQSMTVPVLPRIESELGTDQATASWILTAYLLSASIFTPIIGRLGDAYGKERMLVISLAMLAIGSLVAALAPTIGVMIAARVVTGIGGGVLPLSFGIIRDEFPERKIASAVSVVSSLSAVGLGVGIVLAGPVVTVLGYAWLFWMPFIVNVVAAVAALVFVPESPVRAPGRVPLLPAVLMAGWLTPLLLALTQAPHWGWASGRVIGLLGIAFALALTWVWVEQRLVVPLIDMRMMRVRGVWTTNLVALLAGVGMYASFAFIPQFLQTPASAGYGFGATVTESGIFSLPTAVGSFLVGFVAAPLSMRYGPRALVALGCLVGSLAMFLMAFAHEEAWHIYLNTSLAGLGFGLAFACLATLIVAAVPAEQTGVASGMNANIRTIGGAIGTAVMTSVVTSQVGGDGIPLEAGYTAGFAILGATFLAATLAALSVPRLARQRLEHLEADPDEAIEGALTAGISS